MDTGLEELRQYRNSHFRLVPPEVCPSCGEVMEAFLDGRCDFCRSQSLARAKGVPSLIERFLLDLSSLEDKPSIEQYVTRAPQEHSAILALAAAIADAGMRIRDTHPNEDVRDSGLRHLSADDIWMLDLTLDIMYMLVGELAGKSSPWDDDLDRTTRLLTGLEDATHDRQWKRALRQARAGPAQFQHLREIIPPRRPSRR
jgi:hypothetical protein